MENRKVSFSRRKILSVVKGLLASYTVTALLLMLMALLLLKLKMPWAAVTAGVMVIYLVSCFLGGYLLGKGVGKKQISLGSDPGSRLFCPADDPFRRPPRRGSSAGRAGCFPRFCFAVLEEWPEECWHEKKYFKNARGYDIMVTAEQVCRYPFPEQKLRGRYIPEHVRRNG